MHAVRGFHSNHSPTPLYHQHYKPRHLLPLPMRGPRHIQMQPARVSHPPLSALL